MKKWKLKNHVTDDMLIGCGYHMSHVAVVPTKMVKIVDDKHVIEVCMEEPSYNFWTGEDWKNSRRLFLRECSIVKKSTNTIILQPDVTEHWYYEVKRLSEKDIVTFIQDLMELGYVENEDTL
jgi:hypothetical protein